VLLTAVPRPTGHGVQHPALPVVPIVNYGIHTKRLPLWAFATVEVPEKSDCAGNNHTGLIPKVARKSFT
jgi:hypothetical protein